MCWLRDRRTNDEVPRDWNIKGQHEVVSINKDLGPCWHSKVEDENTVQYLGEVKPTSSRTTISEYKVLLRTLSDDLTDIPSLEMANKFKICKVQEATLTVHFRNINVERSRT